jgi:hypothetical protein
MPKPKPNALVPTGQSVGNLKKATVHDLQFAKARVQGSLYQDALNKVSGKVSGVNADVYFLNIGQPVLTPGPQGSYYSTALTLWNFGGERLLVNAAPHRAKATFNGGTRMRYAVEGALRDNLSEGLRVSAMNAQQRQQACSQSLVVLVPENKGVYQVDITQVGTGKVYNLFRANGLFHAALPAGEYELSRMFASGTMVWDLRRFDSKARFQVGPSSAVLLTGNRLTDRSPNLTALNACLKRVSPTLELRKIPVK